MKDLEVVHDAAAGQFRATVEGLVAVLDYERAPGVMRILHVGVPEAIRRRGIAGRVTRTALEHARAEGLAVEPLCPYAAGYIERNPEYRALVREPE